MAIAPDELDLRISSLGGIPGLTRPITYEEYLNSPEEMRRYDIIDGWKIYRTYGVQNLPNPTRRHQTIQGNLFVTLRAQAMINGQCRAIMAPCDVLISRNPSRFRQPDILVMSNKRWDQNAPSDDPAPLSPAPELVVEILSPSETASSLALKIADYASVGVKEIWIVRPDKETVEIRRLGRDSPLPKFTKNTRTAKSHCFEGLTVPLEVIFSDLS